LVSLPVAPPPETFPLSMSPPPPPIPVPPCQLFLNVNAVVNGFVFVIVPFVIENKGRPPFLPFFSSFSFPSSQPFPFFALLLLSPLGLCL
jgi:hypothetical protein